jgi:hypothetical protein
VKAHLISLAAVWLFFLANTIPLWAEQPWGGVANKIGPLLHKKITEQKQPDESLQQPGLFSVDEEPEQELVKVIVVMDRNHLSELPQDIVDELKERVEALGGHIGNHAFNNVQVWISVEDIEELAHWEEIRAIRLPIKPGPMGIQSEGVNVGNIGTWHTNGVAGQGVKIGILDSGFEGGENLLGTELPSNTNAVYTGSISAFNSTEHGSACAEIVHDIAPGAELFLINVDD